MNVDALVKLYYTALVISTAATAVLAVIARRHALRAGENSRLLWTGSAVAAVAAVGFFILVSAAGFYSSSSSCAGCHEMAPEVDTWRRSAHARVTCLACHLQADSAAGFLVEDLRALKEVYGHITGDYPAVINRDSRVAEEMAGAVCGRCHDPAKLGTVRFGGNAKVDHQPHLELGIACQHCHNRVAHKGARNFNYRDGLRMMDGCMRCHLPGRGARVKDEKAPTGCSTCHPKGWARRVFGKARVKPADFDDCRACHRLRDPDVIREFAGSKMAKAVDCPDCHNDHRERFIADPDPGQCGKCHAGIDKKVVDGIHGRGQKGRHRRRPDTVGQVRCGLCHAPHRFAK